MTRYTDDSRERVREAVDIIDLVSGRTDLRRVGRQEWQGLCPFHDERTPSFGVNPVKKAYHCFGCGASGDVFTFMMQTEGVDFTSALELLADRYGVALERDQEDPAAAARRRRRERLFALLERVATFYTRCLEESPDATSARAHLAERGLEADVLRTFRVGYAPSAWETVCTVARRAGYSDDELLGAGLAVRSRRHGSIYDRFRGRIIFPVLDVRGRVVGFGARALAPDQQPKYLNSSDGPLFRKGRELFGLHLARPEAARLGSWIVVEGYMDVLALHQAGLTNTVAVMGTALTLEQLAELARVAGRIDLALDADEAGQEALVRAAVAAGRRRLDLRVVELPAGSDPAELVAGEGAAAMRSRVERAVPFARFRVERTLATADLGSGQGRDRALGELRAVLGSLGATALREELVREVADRLELSEALVGSLVASAPPPPVPARRPLPPVPGRTGPGGGAPGDRRRDPGPPWARRAGGSAFPTPHPPPDVSSPGEPARAVLERRERTERTFLAMCIALPDAGREALRRVRLDEHFTSPLTRRAARHLRQHLAAPLAGLPPDDAELASLVAELTVRAGREPCAPETLEVETLQLEKERLEREIAAAQAAGRLDIARLAQERNELKDRLDRAVGRAVEGAERM